LKKFLTTSKKGYGALVSWFRVDDQALRWLWPLEDRFASEVRSSRDVSDRMHPFFENLTNHKIG
jgi:hypothetical protein